MVVPLGDGVALADAAVWIALLILAPTYVAHRLGRPTAAVFALLLAISPLLVIYSRMARPYAITLLLGWIAHAAFHRFERGPRGQKAAGFVYRVASALAAWLHPIVKPFVLAPVLWALAQLPRATRGDRAIRFRHLMSVAIPTGVLMAVFVLLPLFAHPHSLTAKVGINMPSIETLLGVWYSWFGTPSTITLLLCLGLAVSGTPSVWRSLPEARTGVFGIALTLLAIFITRPMWSQHSPTVARYLLPAIPLLLLAVAAGAVRLAGQIAAPSTTPRRLAAAGILTLPCLALGAQSPLLTTLPHPNTHTLHGLHYFAFRADKNLFLTRLEMIPLSLFWSSLAERPAGTVRIAAAPFHFESFNWDAPRWQRLSRQTVLPGYLTGLCVDSRRGETPQRLAFRFDNAVHLANGGSLMRQRIDYGVWQKPFTLTERGRRDTVGEDTAHCETVLRSKFGSPAFEDATLIAFHIKRPATSAPDFLQ